MLSQTDALIGIASDSALGQHVNIYKGLGTQKEEDTNIQKLSVVAYLF